MIKRRFFTRRDFLRRSAITGGGLAIAAKLHATKNLTQPGNDSAVRDPLQLKCEYAVNGSF